MQPKFYNVGKETVKSGITNKIISEHLFMYVFMNVWPLGDKIENHVFGLVHEISYLVKKPFVNSYFERKNTHRKPPVALKTHSETHMLYIFARYIFSFIHSALLL